MVALSADRPEKLAGAVEGKTLDYRLLSDNDLAAARAFGIAFRVDDGTAKAYRGHGLDLEAASGRTHQGLPVPAVFLIDGGIVEFAYVHPDYRKRLHPEVLLAAARAIRGDKKGKGESSAR